MPYAGLGLRAVAAAVDGAIFFAIAWLVALVTGGGTAAGFEISGAPFFLALAIWIIYYTAFEASTGASVGKRLAGLRVVKADGSAPDLSAAAVRNVLRLVDGLAFYLVGALLIAGSPRRQRLGDRVAGTVVVRRDRAAQAPDGAAGRAG